MIYDIAGLRIKIENKYEYTTQFCKAYLSLDQISQIDLRVFVTEEEFLAEKRLSPNFPDGYIENVCLYRAICRELPKFNRMLLHAAILEYKGKAYAFLGKSGTGKSTHTGLWLKYLQDAKILNGDKPILEYKAGEFIAYGTPWMGKEGLGYNGQATLCGLCFLEQAPNNQLDLLPLPQTAKRIFTQILFPSEKENAEKTLYLTDKLIAVVPAYLLKCTISKEAVQLSFERMTGETFLPIE